MSKSKGELLKGFGFSYGARGVREFGDPPVLSKSPKKCLKKTVKRCYLGEPYRGTYLTMREAEAMQHIVLGKTLRDTAVSMQISPRTSEFYINNVKRKLKCRTKKELIHKMMTGDFLEKIKLVVK